MAGEKKHTGDNINTNVYEYACDNIYNIFNIQNVKTLHYCWRKEYAGDDSHNIFNIQNIPTLHHCGRKENAGDSGLRLTHAQSTGRRRLTNPVPKFQNSTKCEQKSANIRKRTQNPYLCQKNSPCILWKWKSAKIWAAPHKLGPEISETRLAKLLKIESFSPLCSAELFFIVSMGNIVTQIGFIFGSKGLYNDAKAQDVII